jgi:hypothetical protein
MTFSRKALVLITSGLLLAGCESDNLWPSLSGEAPAATSAQAQTSGTVPNAPSPVANSSTGSAYSAPVATGASSAAAPVVSGPAPKSTGTFVGKKIVSMRSDLGKLKGAINRLNSRMTTLRTENESSTQRYHGVVAAMNAKLQAGTTPGNPVLVKQWNEAQKQLEKIEGNISKMNGLSNDSGSEATVAGYLLDSVRATYTLSGAVDEDHVQLRGLEDEVNRTVVFIDRLLNELSNDINRQTGYLSNERRNLTTMSIAIKNGERYGASLMNRAFAQAEIKARTAARSGKRRASSRPLVVIRFDRDNVAYQQALYNAVSRAVERKPDAAFDLVAVSPKVGSPSLRILNTTAAKRNAEGVLRTLTDMGLPASRVNLTATNSATARSNEVRVYVR